MNIKNNQGDLMTQVPQEPQQPQGGWSYAYVCCDASCCITYFSMSAQ